MAFHWIVSGVINVEVAIRKLMPSDMLGCRCVMVDCECIRGVDRWSQERGDHVILPKLPQVGRSSVSRFIEISLFSFSKLLRIPHHFITSQSFVFDFDEVYSLSLIAM